MTQGKGQAAALSYLRARLAYEIDVLDVAQGLAASRLTVVDTRKQESWNHGHIPGALHLPGELRGGDLSLGVDVDTPVVVYGWGPGCNGATNAALTLTEHGYTVREMVGGFEYWCRTGLPIESADGVIRHLPDPLVTAERPSF